MAEYDLITKIDELERDRKADYSIWGYLYQFDITLYDCISQFNEDNYFCDNIGISTEVLYQIETVEDYVKAFVKDNEYNIRLAQVKYHTQSSTPDEISVIIDLYYDFLLLCSLENRKVNIKTRLIYYSQKQIGSKCCKEKILKKIDQITGHFAKSYIENIRTEYLDRLNKYTKHEDRVKDVFQNLSSIELLDEFYDKYESIYEYESKLLREKLGNLLDIRYNGFIPELNPVLRGEVLYSIGIDYLISMWSNKANKDDIIKIRVEDIDNHIKNIISHIENSFDCYYKETIINAVGSALKNYEVSLAYEFGDNQDDINKIMSIYKGTVSDYTIQLLTKFLVSREARFAFLTTVSLSEIPNKEEYLGFNSINELYVFASQKVYIESFILRLMKFLYVLEVEDGITLDTLEDILTVEDGLLIFKHPKENRTCMLFPNYNTELSPLIVLASLISRLKDRENRPDVWYFHNLDRGKICMGKNHSYNIDFTKPSAFKNRPTHPVKDSFFVECLRCLETDSSYECMNVKCIFKGGCKQDD